MSVVEAIKHYQRSLEKCQGNHERMLHCISKLYRLPVTVQHLQDTGIGRTVNNLRRFEGDTGEAAKALVAKWKAMVAAEDSSEGEDQEENHQNSVEEEEQPHKQEDHLKSNKYRSHNDKERSYHKEKTQHEKDKSHHSREKSQHSREKSYHDRDRSQYEKDKSHHNKKYNVDERSKKSSSHEQSKKRKYEEENGKKSEKRRCKHETESESSESEDNFAVGEDDDSGHDSEAQSTSQTSQNIEEDSSDEEPVPQKQKNHISAKEHNSKSHSYSKGHSSSKEHRSSKEYVSNKEHSSHRKDKGRSKYKTENNDRKDEKQKEEKSKKQKSSSHIPEKKHSVKIKKEKADTEDGSIDCSTGASFAEALGMVDPIVKKKQHTSISSPSTSSASRTSKSTISTISKKKDTPTPTPIPISTPTKSSREMNLLAPNVKLEPLDVDLDSTLPPITPNYKPLPHYNFLDSPPHRKVKQLTEEEALCQVMSTKNQRTKVYSGVKSGKSWATVPSLYDICVRVLQENIDALEYTGGVPYDLLKPVLQHANPEQLFMLEHHNPYLIDDTDELWKFHCQKQFRSKQRQDMETSREMYLRCLDEREAKLKALTTNIQQSIAKSTPVRQTKLAYVDSVAKPPRNVARQQAKYGTANKVSKPSPAAKATAKASALTASVSSIATPVPPPRTIQTVTKQKPRMAPLMQKTMKLVKSFKR